MYRSRINYSTIVLATLFLLVICLIGCQTIPEPIETSEIPSLYVRPVSTDVDALRQLINLPFEPVSVQFQESTTTISPKGNDRSVPGPSDSWNHITAVLQVDDQSLALMRGEATESTTEPFNIWSDADFEVWYPDEIKRSFTLDLDSGEYMLDTPLYDATYLFGTEKFLYGTFFVADNNYVGLRLTQ